MTQKNRRVWLRPLVFIGVGLAIGIGLGFYVGWVAWPAEFTNANPAVLQAEYRRDYALMIADAYAADGDLASARERVATLGEDGPAFLLSLLLDLILRGENESDIRRLAALAADLGLYSPAMEPYLDQGEPGS